MARRVWSSLLSAEQFDHGSRILTNRPCSDYCVGFHPQYRCLNCSLLSIKTIEVNTSL